MKILFSLAKTRLLSIAIMFTLIIFPEHSRSFIQRSPKLEVLVQPNGEENFQHLKTDAETRRSSATTYQALDKFFVINYQPAHRKQTKHERTCTENCQLLILSICCMYLITHWNQCDKSFPSLEFSKMCRWMVSYILQDRPWKYSS